MKHKPNYYIDLEFKDGMMLEKANLKEYDITVTFLNETNIRYTGTKDNLIKYITIYYDPNASDDELDYNYYLQNIKLLPR